MEGSGNLTGWQRGAYHRPQGEGSGYVRTPGAGSEFVSATQDGAIWTIRERIVPPGGGDPAALYGRMVYDVDLGGGGAGEGVVAD
ncbi:MAG: hypothetical protein R3F11_29560 [Verrucomicrobiales bacterium]